ncbi:hypothetical protein SCP_0603790 [Sparassis crispa]|uniref:Uncharacterized protein n=1 Tax=Sparassis crispa TaxID=139825 RepID=A0A401GQG3_9APHY|nr:hypothetical protein SCP_0603790 [Sparassis crispa]GBE84400.1 hypothetical protein SCP_0603790 [Sparassis crispa]
MLDLSERVIVDQSKLGYKEACESKVTLSRQAQFERRNALFEEVGIQKWFEDNSIPYDTQPKMKCSGKDYLTASNVSQNQLEQVYNWTFSKGRVGESVPLRHVTRHAVKILIGETSAANSSTIKIPDAWLANRQVQINEASPFRMLRKTLLLYLEYANEEHIKYREGLDEAPTPLFDLSGDRKTGAESILDLSLYDSENVHSSGALSIECAMLKLFGYPGTLKTISEMDVERHIGPILSGIFNIPGCAGLSSTILKYPTILSCFDSYPRPDHACQISAERLPGIKFCRPLVLAGEARRPQSRVPQVEDTPSGSASNSRVKFPRPASQLAWAFQPTLELFIMDLVTKYRNPGGKTWKKEWDPLANAAIPSHMVVFGIVYDTDGIIFYFYSPTYKVSDGKYTSERYCFEHCSLPLLGVTSWRRRGLTICHFLR